MASSASRLAGTSNVNDPAPASSRDFISGSWGAPVPDSRHSLTAGPNGPILLQDIHYYDKITQFDREIIPERVVHANGAGAYGYFETLEDLSDITKAAVFRGKGTRTETFVRFSHVTGERGAADTERDPRGMAIKMYTPEGNWDLVCNNFPVFFIRDPMLFPDAIHAQKRNPKTDLKDASAFWDFMANTPESVHILLMLYSDRGVPYSYRHLNGYGNHAFRFVNARGEGTWVKFHVKSEAGVKSLTSAAAEALRGADTDWAKRDLSDYISSGGQAAWTMFVQLIPEADVPKLKYDIFDVTKVVPHGDYPLRAVGRLVLNRMPENYHNETEQSAFCPGNLVPGIEPSPDRILQGRLMSYRDTQLHRLGKNHTQLPVNAARCPMHTHYRAGFFALRNPGGETHYHTGNPASGGAQRNDTRGLEAPLAVAGDLGRYDNGPREGMVDDFTQPRVFYNRVLTQDERDRLVFNIVGHLQQAQGHTQKAMADLFKRVDADLGSRVEAGLARAAAGELLATAAKEPSGQPPTLVEMDVKQGHAVVDLKVAPGGGGAGGTGNMEHRGRADAASIKPATATGTAGAAADKAGPFKGVVDAVKSGITSGIASMMPGQ